MVWNTLLRRQLFFTQLVLDARAVYSTKGGGSFSSESKVQGLWHRKSCYKTDCSRVSLLFSTKSSTMSELKRVCIVGSGNW